MIQWYDYANTGLRGCVTRPSDSFVDDFGNLIEFWMPDQNLWAKSWYCYHTSYHNGYDKDHLYIM